MSRQPARVLTDGDVRRLLLYARHTRYPERNRVIIYLSFKAGLRACEISGLTWPMVLTSSGYIDSSLMITSAITKGRSGRRIPMHRQLKRSLVIWHARNDHPPTGPVICSERAMSDGSAATMSARSLVNWFSAIYQELELYGCSSHSGRRTFITNAARALSQTGGSLRDVQELAGHRALSTTERYIQGDRDVQHKLVSLI